LSMTSSSIRNIQSSNFTLYTFLSTGKACFKLPHGCGPW
jgi:hypothetical protein